MEKNSKSMFLLDRLRSGEKVKCTNCQKGIYITYPGQIATSHEFWCNNCGIVYRVTPNIIVE